MKIKVKLFSFLMIMLLCSFNFHPVNMCVGDVSSKGNKINVKFKFFADNLQNIITKRCGYVDLETSGYDSKTERCLQQYIAGRFELSVNNAPCKLIYKKGVLNQGVLLIEYEATLKPGKLKSVKIKNTLLFDADLPEMKNIMNILLAGKIKVLEFDNNEAVRTGVYTQQVTY